MPAGLSNEALGAGLRCGDDSRQIIRVHQPAVQLKGRQFDSGLQAEQAAMTIGPLDRVGIEIPVEYAGPRQVQPDLKSAFTTAQLAGFLVDPPLRQHLRGSDRVDSPVQPFGVVRPSRTGEIEFYNQREARLSGNVDPPMVGADFVGAIAPCMDTPQMRGRIERTLASGSLDLDMIHIGDFFDRSRSHRIRSVVKLVPLNQASADFFAPRTFMAASPICRITSAQLAEYTPQAIQSTLLSRKTQNPQFRRASMLDPTSHAAARVATIAGH